MQEPQPAPDIQVQQLSYLQQRVRQGALLNLAASALVVLLMSTHIPFRDLASWFFALLLANGVRLFLARQLTPSVDGQGIRRQFHVLSLSAGVIGLAWGYGTWLLAADADITVQTQMVIALAGMLAAGAFGHAAYMPATFAYVACIAIPMLLWIHQHWGGPQLEFQVLLLVYVAAILLFARNHNRQLLNALTLASENSRLVDRLRQEVDNRSQLETTAREAESQLRTLIERAPDGILVVREDGEIVLANNEAHRLFGYQGRELLGHRIEDLVPADMRYKHAALRESHLDHPTRGYINTSRQIMGLRRDGTQFPVEVALSTAQTASGLLTYASVRDLSLHKHLEQLEHEMQERRKAEQSLQKLYREQAAILNATNDHIIYMTPEGRLVWWNLAVEESLGLVHEELDNAAFTGFFSEEEQLAIASTIANTLSTGKASVEAVLMTVEGPRLYEFNNVLLTDEQDQPLGIVSIGRDTSEKRENERLIAEAQHVARLAHWRWNKKSGECTCSSEAYSLYGRPHYSGKLTRGMMFEAIHPDDRERVLRAMEGLERPGRSIKLDHRIIWPDSSVHWLHLEAKGLHGNAGQLEQIHGTIQEITERKAMEQSLRESEQRLALAIKGGDHGIWDWDLLTGEVYYSPRWKEMLGYQDSELSNRLETWQQLVHPDDLQQAQQQIEDHLANRIDRFATELRMRHKDGHYLHILSRGQIFRDESGQPYRFSGIHEDISDRKRAELLEKGQRRVYQLLASNGTLTEMLEALVGLMVSVDPDTRSSVLLLDEAGQHLHLGASHGLPEFYNEAIEGLAIGEGLGSCGTAAATGKAVIVEDIRTHPYWKDYRQLAEQAGLRSCWSTPIIGATGKVLGTFANYHDRPSTPNEADLALLDDAARLASIAIERHRMQSATKELQIQLQQAQKMEAIGHLAGGIAHDFNNILATIMGFTDLAIGGLDAGRTEKLPGYLSQVSQATGRARDLVKQLLTFSRIQKGSRSSTNLGEILREVANLLKPTLPSSIDLRVEPADLYAAVDPVQIHQVLMNLALNARDALEGQGLLSISLEAAEHLQGLCASCHNDFAGRYAMIRVTDSGHGIPPAMLDRMFDPFASTKEVGKGSGMGLAITHGIIHEHGGHILVDSRPGHTEFKLLIPLTPEEAPPLKSTEVEPDTSRTDDAGQHRLMVVDDEAALGEMLSELLREAGYRVSTFSSSLEALAAFKAAPDGFDLVITDQTMPGLSGGDMSQAMLALRPELPIMLCTGFSDRIDESAAKELGIRAFLMKPVKNDILLRQTQDLLSEPA